jgi:hypothetical protein
MDWSSTEFCIGANIRDNASGFFAADDEGSRGFFIAVIVSYFWRDFMQRRIETKGKDKLKE